MARNRKSLRYLRYAVQAWFLGFCVYMGRAFYQFVMQFDPEAAYSGPPLTRPDSVDAFLPIGGFMGTKLLAITGHIELMHPAAVMSFIAIVGMSVVARKSFCGWVCPVGTISQYVWMVGEKIFGRNFRIPQMGDLGLRSIKYILVFTFVGFIMIMPSYFLLLYMLDEYYMVVDVRMLNLFMDMSSLTATVLISLVVLSVFFKNFWCRYLCPYGALLGLVGKLSPFRVVRDESKCIHCHACTKHCPTLIEVESKAEVTSAECIGCMTCVSRCPKEGALEMGVKLGRNRIALKRPAIFAAAAVATLYLVIGLAMLGGVWKSQVPREEYSRMIPKVLYPDTYGKEEVKEDRDEVYKGPSGSYDREPSSPSK